MADRKDKPHVKTFLKGSLIELKTESDMGWYAHDLYRWSFEVVDTKKHFVFRNEENVWQ